MMAGRRSAPCWSRPGTPGLIVEPAYRKLGWHASDTHGLTLAGCRVPAGNLLGARGRGLRQFLAILDDGRIAISALALGLARACLEACTEQARTRVAFGRPIGANQGSGVRRRRPAVAVEAAAAAGVQGGLAARRAHRRAAGLAEVSQAAAIAKLLASTAAVDAARVATQVFGGAGFIEESPVARFYRDAKILEIGEGTSEIQRLVIARGLGLPVEPVAAVQRGRRDDQTTRELAAARGRPRRRPSAAPPSSPRHGKLPVRERIALLVRRRLLHRGRPAGELPPRGGSASPEPGCRPTAWSPAGGWSTAGLRSSSPTTRP